MQGASPASLDVLTGRKSSSDEEWEAALNSFIANLVAEHEPTIHPPHEEIQLVVQALLNKLKSIWVKGKVKIQVFEKTVLSLLLLAQEHPEAASNERFESIVQEEILDRYPLNDFLQGAGNKLLDIAEHLESLDLSVPPFQCPPFQKALPYFPDYGYQVTLRMSDDKLDADIQKAIIALVKDLKGKYSRLMYN